MTVDPICVCLGCGHVADLGSAVWIGDRPFHAACVERHDRPLHVTGHASPRDEGSVLDGEFIDEWTEVLGATVVVLLVHSARRLLTDPSFDTTEVEWSRRLGISPTKLRSVLGRATRFGFIDRRGDDVSLRLTVPRRRPSIEQPRPTGRRRTDGRRRSAVQATGHPRGADGASRPESAVQRPGEALHTIHTPTTEGDPSWGQ